MVQTIFDKFGIKERLSIIYTLKCNIRCEHCILNCSPDREEKMPMETAKEILEVSLNFGKKYVVFSGGEIFIYYDELLELARLCNELGYYYGIETNGYWANSPQKTLKVMQELKKLGLSSMYLSIDSYHLAYVSLENQLNIIDACNKVEIDYEVSFTPSKDIEKDKNILEFFEEYKVNYFIEPLLNSGRGKKLDSHNKYIVSQLKDCDSYCTTFLPNGDMYACCDISDTNANIERTSIYYGNVHKTPLRQLYKFSKCEFLMKLYDEKSSIYFRKLLLREEFNELRTQEYSNICEFCCNFLVNTNLLQILKDYME